MQAKKVPQTIPELFDVVMRLFGGVGSHLSNLEERFDAVDKRFDFIDQQIVKLRQETNQGFIQVNQKVQEVVRRLDNMEGKTPAPGATHKPEPLPLAAK